MASAVDLFLMKALSKFELINLPTLIIEHLYKVIHIKNGKHGLSYGYLLTKVFKHFKVECIRGVVGAANQIFTVNTLIKNKYVEGKFRIKFKCLSGWIFRNNKVESWKK